MYVAYIAPCIVSSRYSRLGFIAFLNHLLAMDLSGPRLIPPCSSTPRTTNIYVHIYLDDIFVICTDLGFISCLICVLSIEFSLKDLGPLHYFLAIKVVPHSSWIILSQQMYISNLLPKTSLVDAKHFGPFFSHPTKYRHLVGTLQYITLTQPDSCFSINKVFQFMHQPTETHRSAVK